MRHSAKDGEQADGEGGHCNDESNQHEHLLTPYSLFDGFIVSCLTSLCNKKSRAMTENHRLTQNPLQGCNYTSEQFPAVLLFNRLEHLNPVCNFTLGREETSDEVVLQPLKVGFHLTQFVMILFQDFKGNFPKKNNQIPSDLLIDQRDMHVDSLDCGLVEVAHDLFFLLVTSDTVIMTYHLQNCKRILKQISECLID